MNLDEVPRMGQAPGDGVRPIARSVPPRPWTEPTRRRFLKMSVLGGAAVSLTLVGRLPTARASHAQNCTSSEATLMWNTTTTGPCGPGGYAQSHNCSGCTASKVCAHCCRSSTIYHRNLSDNAAYRHRENMCYTGGYDGWRWARTGCACCNQGQTWTCHDGCYNASGHWQETICRKTAVCNCNPQIQSCCT